MPDAQIDSTSGYPTKQLSTGQAANVHVPFGLPKGMLGDITGLVRKPNSVVLCHDTFEEDASGWLQLFTPRSSPVESAISRGTASRIISRGEPRILIRTPAVASAEVMGIKRMGNWHGDGRYLVEFLTSIEFVNLSTDRPRWYGWGLDIALADGTRKYFYVRWLNYDEAGASQPRKFQIKLADGSYADVPNGSFTWQANENKALPVYMAMVVNTTTGLFEGFRVNAAIREGSLAATSSSSMTALGVVYNETLTAFSGGLNPFFDLVNRSNAAQTRGAISIHEHRTTYLGA